MIYLNNAATSWPKPREVVERMLWAMTELTAAPGRSSAASLASDRAIYKARKAAAAFVGCGDSARVVFTANATAALNLAITGLLKRGDHVVTTSVDHNSVARPLTRAQERLAVSVTRVAADRLGEVSAQAVLAAVTPATRLVVLTHGSNVVGSIQPVGEVGRLLRRLPSSRPLLLVDAAQTAGALFIDVAEMGIDLLAVPGHKSLYGPQGTGFLYAAPGVDLDPLVEGGTGGHSDLDRQPLAMPMRYESGTPNTPGIVALGEAIGYLNSLGLDRVRDHEARLLSILLEGLSGIRGVVIHGPADPERQLAVLSFTVEGVDPSEVGTFLYETRDIQVRVGLHCSPHSHRTIGTFPEGTVRVSPGLFNGENDVLALVEGVRDLARLKGF